MAPNPDMLKRRKWKREFQEIATDEGLQEVILEIAVEQKVTSDRLTVNEEQDKKHRKTPLDKAHPWTKETYLRIGIIVAALSAASGTATAIALPM